MKNAVKNWLANPNSDYDDGLALYHKTKRNTEYDKFLESGKGSRPKSLHHNMLRSQLTIQHRWLVDSIETEEVKKPELPPITHKPIGATPTPGIVSTTFNQHINVDSLPKELQIVFESNKAGQDELKTLHANMKRAESEEKRAMFRKELIKTEDFIIAGWKKINEFIKNPTNWKPKTAEETDALNVLRMKRRADNLTIYIPRDTRKLENIEDKESTKYKELQSKIEDMKKELEHLRITLKIDE
jgi:hypothetical protein